MLTENDVHDKIDQLVMEFTDQFPDGPDFLEELQKYLSENTSDWKLFFIDEDLHIQFDGKEIKREFDGGK